MPLFALLTLLLTAGLAYATYRSAQLLPLLPRDTNLLLNPVDLGARLVLCLVCWGLGGLSGIGPTALGWTAETPVADLALGLAVGILAHVVLYPLTLWAAQRLGPRAYSSLLLRHIVPRSAHEWALVPLVLVPAVLLEELLFRSLWLGGLGAMLTAAWPGGLGPLLFLSIVSAAIFGWMHAPQGWLGMVLAALIGLGLSLLFLWRGSLLAPLAAHWVFNVVQLARADGALTIDD